LAWEALPCVQSPTLLIVGGNDDAVIQFNRDALERISAKKELSIVSGATHLFEEPGALEQVAQSACRWFKAHLRRQESPLETSYE